MLNKLLDIKFEGFGDYYSALGCEMNNAESVINAELSKCDDVELLKSLAVKFNGVRDFFGVVDRLEDLMDEDSLDDFLSANGVA